MSVVVDLAVYKATGTVVASRNTLANTNSPRTLVEQTISDELAATIGRDSPNFDDEFLKRRRELLGPKAVSLRL